MCIVFTLSLPVCQNPSGLYEPFLQISWILVAACTGESVGLGVADTEPMVQGIVTASVGSLGNNGAVAHTDRVHKPVSIMRTLQP